MKAWLVEQKDGRPNFSDWQRVDFHDYTKLHPKTKYRLEPIISTRSQLQNNLYWIFLGKIERETGNNADDLHEWAKRKFLKPRFIKIKDEEMKIPGSTTRLNKLDFGDYLDKISAETGVAIPIPEEAGYYTK